MPQKKDILFVVDRGGNMQAVQLSPELWKLVEADVLARARTLESPDVIADRPDAISDFKEFISSWDFPYPYSPAITCPQCGAHTDDWSGDAAHPFHLLNANIGGLLVFYCTHCHGLVRLKHFKDHVAVEYTAKS